MTPLLELCTVTKSFQITSGNTSIMGPQESLPDTRLEQLESKRVALSSHINSRASRFLESLLFLYKENKEICGKTLGRMECSLWALPVSAMIVLLWTAGLSESGSTLYVGLARTAPPTNTNFRLTFLLTRLQESLYENLPV